MNDIRDKFPFFTANPHTIYFDNASTTQKPKAVLDSINEYFVEYCSNAGRGSYTIANRVTKELEMVREKIKAFINAHSIEEIIFTSGATASLNSVAYSWGLHNLKTDDEVLICLEDHDSNVLPWINLKNTLGHLGISIKIIPFKNTVAGDAREEDILAKITKKTRLIALTHVHNVYGMETDIEELKKKIPSNILLSLDAAQSIGHIPVDVQKLGVDFVSFSGHKMFASTGVGVLWISQKIHNQIHPFMVGGGTYNQLPHLLEGGTQNLAGIISLGAAIDFINKITINSIQEKILTLSQYLLAKLRVLNRIEFLPGIAFSQCALGYGIIAFNISDMPSNEVGFILNEHKIYLRTGSHCTGGGNNINDSIRASMHVYNTEQEVDKFIEVLRAII